MSDTIIKNARIFTKHRIREANLLIEDGRVQKITKTLPKLHSTGSFDQIINARGDLVLPSGIDVHVHFRDLEEKHKEDWYTGSLSAAAGGITTVIEHPNTRPPTTDKKSFQQKLTQASSSSIIDFGINAGVTSDNLEELRELWRLGATSFGEIFLAESTGKLHISKEKLKPVIKEITNLGAVACIHAEDEELNTTLKDRYRNNPLQHSLEHPPESEEQAVTTTLDASTDAAKLHFCHISTQNAVNRIKNAKESGYNITCEATPHHLFLTTKNCQALGTHAKVNPPLRDPHHAASLWTAINNHTIDIIASDHAPHTLEEKNTTLLDAPSGVPGVETLMPLLLNAAKHNHLPLRRLIEVTRINPARRFKLHNKGELKAGYDADLLIVNTHCTTTIRADRLRSKAGWTPFENMPALFPRITMLRGEIIWEDGAAVRRGYGRFLPGEGAER